MSDLQQVSPRSKMKLLRENVPKARKRRRVSQEDFQILKPGEEERLKETIMLSS